MKLCILEQKSYNGHSQKMSKIVSSFGKFPHGTEFYASNRTLLTKSGLEDVLDRELGVWREHSPEYYVSKVVKQIHQDT